MSKMDGKKELGYIKNKKRGEEKKEIGKNKKRVVSSIRNNLLQRMIKYISITAEFTVTCIIE
jgi:hypothetical protein